MVTDCGNNWAGWSNKDYDRLILEASNEADNGRRMELFQRAEAILLGEAPLIPLYFRPNVYAISPAVRGLTTTQVGYHEFNRIWLEK
jgi:oligopeptide transport system substrate-binding protein